MNASAQSSSEKVALLDVGEVSQMLGCSARHVYRLADAGRMPSPIKLGALVRWDRMVIDSWIAQGCPAVRSTKRPGR